jgi:hypothetical protein
MRSSKFERINQPSYPLLNLGILPSASTSTIAFLGVTQVLDHGSVLSDTRAGGSRSLVQKFGHIRNSNSHQDYKIYDKESTQLHC